MCSLHVPASRRTLGSVNNRGRGYIHAKRQNQQIIHFGNSMMHILFPQINQRYKFIYLMLKLF